MGFQPASARLRAAIALCALTAVAALAAAGCGGSEGSSSGSEATSGAFPKAVKANERWEKRPTSIGLKTPVSKPIPTGKVIDFIQCPLPACGAG